MDGWRDGAAVGPLLEACLLLGDVADDVADGLEGGQGLVVEVRQLELGLSVDTQWTEGGSGRRGEGRTEETGADKVCRGGRLREGVAGYVINV